MFCTKCGKEIKEGMKFCTGCGAPVKQKIVEAAPEVSEPVESAAAPVTPATPAAPVVNPAPVKKPVKAKKEKSGSKGLIIVLIIIVVLLVLGVAFTSFWYLGGREMVYEKMGISAEVEDDEDEDRKSKKDDSDEEDDKEVKDKKDKKDKKKDKEKEEDAVTEVDADEMAPVEVPEAAAVEEVVEEEVEEIVSEYILEDSASRYLTMADLRGLSADECRIARNEIYARHGRLFDDEALQSHFNECRWYDGYIEGKDFKESMLSDIEMANRDLIVKYEEEMGYR